MTNSQLDVVVVGGAMHGAGLAWFLATNPDFDGSIRVIERDPSYEFASTSHTNSCMRQQFSTELNIRISQYAASYLAELNEPVWQQLEAPRIRIREFGYLYLADNEAFADSLRRNQQLQAACGVATEILSAQEIRARYPFYQLDDVLLGSLNRTNEGYFDGSALFQWWRQSSAQLGAKYLTDEVVGLELNGSSERVTAVKLASGETLGCDVLVNAAGPRAGQIAAMAGIELPVEPRKRYSYLFAAANPLPQDLPLTIDPGGVHVRSDASHYLAGCPPETDPAVAFDDFDMDHTLWEEKVWPAIANRIPQFDSVKLLSSWVGHYAFNAFDQNAIVGPHPQIENLLFVNGFSGHGLQQAPAMGRGLAEWIVYGAYQTLDLSPLSFSRIVANKPVVERAVI